MNKQEFFEQLSRVKEASAVLALSDVEQRNMVLSCIAKELKDKESEILTANQKDLDRLEKTNLMRDRLLLTKERIDEMVADIKAVINLPDPLNNVLEQREIKPGLRIKKVSVPFGVIGVIYESRPNVTVDVVNLCLKSGNGVVLKAGEEIADSNTILIDLLKQAVQKAGLPEGLIFSIDPKNGELVDYLLEAKDWVDVVIPRGGAGLINFVREKTKIPVIETGAGVCHTFVDEDADIAMASNIVFNAKTSRPSVCNALDTLLVHKKSARKLFETLAPKLGEKQTEIFADSFSYNILKELNYPFLQEARASDFGREFLCLKMAVRTVINIDEALEHIKRYSTKHSEAIVTNNQKNAERFLKEVDAACCYHNVSTRFTDGSQFGMGGEIGISTQKLHARGPMSVKELTTYKWLIEGRGQVRE